MSIMKLKNAILYFIISFLKVLPRIIYRSTLSIIFDIKGSQKFINDILNAQDLRLTDKKLNTINLADLFGNNNIDIIIEGTYYIKKSSDTRDLFELANIEYLVKSVDPNIIFEIGTFVGRSTRLFALNSNTDCLIYTLDLPQNMVSHSVGFEFKNKPEAIRYINYLGIVRVSILHPIMEK